MEFFVPLPTSYRFLVVSDIDGNSAARIAEKFVPDEPKFDAILLCGPFVQSNFSTDEEKAVVEGDIASIIAQFENIVCRVIYLPSEYDPPETLIHQLNLTPNSINIHARRLNLADGLFLLGFTEKGEKSVQGKDKKAVLDDRDRSCESDDELETVEVASSTSVSIIHELLAHGEEKIPESHGEVTTTAAATAKPESGIFMLNYRFSHTLNQLLFHMSGDLDAAGICLCVISSVDCPETARLPTKFGKLHLAAPKSLREGGHYSIVNIALDAATGKWNDITIEAGQLD